MEGKLRAKKNNGCSILSLVGYTVKHTSIIWSIFTFVMLWIIPLTALINNSWSANMHYLTSIDDLRYLIIPFCIIIAIRTFDYLTKEKATAFFHHLPYTRTKLFSVMGITGFVLIIGSLFIVTLSTIIISSVQGAPHGATIMKLFGMLCCESFYIYAFTILMIMLFSNIVSVLSMTAILFCYAELMFFIANTIICNLLNVTGVISAPKGWFMILSPVRVCISYNFSFNYITGSYGFIGIEKVLPIELICGSLMIILAYILYRKRKSEVSGEIVAFKSCRYIFKWGFSISLSAFLTTLLGITSTYYIYDTSVKNTIICSMFIFFTLMLYIIAEMIIYKRFNVFKQIRFQLIPVFLVVLALCTITVSDVFGIKDYIPDYNDTQYMTVRAEIQDKDDPLLIKNYIVRMNNDPEDNVKKAAFYDLHEKIITQKGLGYSLNAKIQFVYYDNNLNYYIREYDIPRGYIEPLTKYMEKIDYLKPSESLYYDDVQIPDIKFSFKKFVNYAYT